MKNATPSSVPSVPSDFFESSSSQLIKTKVEDKMDEEIENNDELDIDKGELPKGFFDDPMVDAKVSNKYNLNSPKVL